MGWDVLFIQTNQLSYELRQLCPPPSFPKLSSPPLHTVLLGPAPLREVSSVERQATMSHECPRRISSISSKHDFWIIENNSVCVCCVHDCWICLENRSVKCRSAHLQPATLPAQKCTFCPLPLQFAKVSGSLSVFLPCKLNSTLKGSRASFSIWGINMFCLFAAHFSPCCVMQL